LRLAYLEGRAVLLVGGAHERFVDVEQRSGGSFAADPMALLERWDDLRDWAAGLEAGAADGEVDPAELGPCVPRPRKVFGIGLNYRDHAAEAGLDLPKQPMVFTKFPSCLVGPRADVVLTGDRVDWEVELVVAIGRGGRRIAVKDALDHVAGYCVGQDVSDRKAQFADKPPQFSLGKSADTFGPIGPALTTLDAVAAAGADPADLRLTCDVASERMQDGRTSDMIFPVPELVAFLSRTLPLEPGDLIFTGTPAGVGSVRTPRRYLAPGDELASEIEALGTLRNACVAGSDDS
jgi:2-keto-4-pentenoate hydratase/2-oxohepta-3-ene-1,7-dioic acid hydratase in catechol pathway